MVKFQSSDKPASNAKAASVGSNCKTLRKRKQAKPAVKLSFRSPLVRRSNIAPCNSEQLRMILERLTAVFRSSKDSTTENCRVLRNILIVGINAVTKALESGQKTVICVLICKDITPKILVEHLPIMACLRQIPCLIVPCSSRKLGQCLGVPVATCFALLADATDPDLILQQCIQTLCQYSTIPKIPWLETSTPSFCPPELDENYAKRGIKKES